MSISCPQLFILHLGSKAMFYLAAAVSDFYIPASEMPEHKIQSSNGPLQVSGENLPTNCYKYNIFFIAELAAQLEEYRCRSVG